MEEFDDLMDALSEPPGSARWEAAFDELHALILSYARAQMGPGVREAFESVELADSVLGSFFGELGSSRLHFADGAALRAYVRRVTGNKVIDYRRRLDARKRGGGIRHQRIGANAEEGEVDPADGAASPSAKAAEADEIERITRDLDEEDHRLIDLVLEGQSINAIARQCAITAEAARKRFQRLLQRLRSRFADGDPEA